MTAAANTALVQRYFDERWNRRNPAICDEVLDPHRAKWQKAFVRATHEALADLECTLLDLVAEGDLVAVHWQFAGTHRGELLGVPAAGKRVVCRGVALLRVVGGRVVEDVAYTDNLALLRQLGAPPPAGR